MESKPPLTVSVEALSSPAYEVVLDALGDRTRRAILQRLRDGPKPVVEIARGLPVSRPAVSQHLKVLKDAGLVADRAEGNRRLYAVDANGLAALRTFLELFWQDGSLGPLPGSGGQPAADEGEASLAPTEAR